MDHPNFVRGRLRVDVHAPITDATVTLRGGRKVSGSVLTGASQTVASDAQLWLSSNGVDDPLVTRANQAGQFVFPHVRPGRYVLRGALAAASAEMDLTVAENAEDLTGVLLHLKARLIQGRIYGLKPGDNVTAVGTNATGFSTAAQPTSSGEFTLDGVPQGPLSVSVTRLNAVTRAAVEKTVETIVPEDGNAPLLEIRFDEGCSISGRLTRGSAPVADALVVVVSQKTNNSVSARSNPAGEFSVDLEEGAHDLSVLDRRNSAPVRRVIHACSSEPIDIDLPALRLAGQVLENDGGDDIPSATVELIIADEKTVASAVVTTDGFGHFKFEDLDPKKRYTLVVRKPGYRSKEIDVEGGAVPQDLVVKLDRGDGLWLRAFDIAMRTPLQSLFVRAVNADGRETFMGAVTTDEGGVASLPLSPGRYMLRLHAPGYAPILLREVAVPRGVLPVAFSVGGTVQIRIGTERIPVRTEITNEGDDEVPLAFEDPSGELWLRQPVTTIEHLPPGRYKLKIAEQHASALEFEVRIGELSIVDVPLQ